jgi:tRNA (guanine-N1)-methyltransferase
VRADYPTTPDEMEWGVEELRADFEAEGIPIRVLHGAELDLSLLWQVPPEDLRRLTIAQTGRYLLLETPYRGWPMALATTVRSLVHSGVTPLLAHPERNPEVQDRPDRVRELVDAGALVQVTASSLAGELNRAVQHAADQLVELGLVHVLASDAHGPHIARGGIPAAVEALGARAPIVLLSPRGRRFAQADALRFAAGGELTLLCGHYKDVDQRVADHLATEELSLGDFVLSGGEPAALAMIDATVRLLPGAMSDLESARTDSFYGRGLSAPSYTRPPEYRGLAVPEVLRSGNHAEIAAWRQQESERLTRERRPDLWQRHVQSD